MLIIKISFDAKTCYGLLIISTLVNIIMKVNVTFLYGNADTGCTDLQKYECNTCMHFQFLHQIKQQ